MDADFVEKIVQEVKSQGVFDEFRKDSLADVDTKPAYQNLRNRVETAVKSFLSEQKWTPETNKIQLREKLRKHITELGFLDVGVDRIVDQVVNPKIGTVFEPKIELIAYKYLGIPLPEPTCKPPPQPPIIAPPPLPPLNLHGPLLSVETTGSLLPTDLEQISPDSDRATVKSDFKDESKDDDELPPGVDAEDIEPIEEVVSPPFEPLNESKCLKVKSECKVEVEKYVLKEESKDGDKSKTPEDVKQERNITMDVEKDVVNESLDAGASQETLLSQVSSDSRITLASIESIPEIPRLTNNSVGSVNAAVNISEEAQMPKFNDNSCDTNLGQTAMTSQLHFDIKKNVIKFEGTERKGSMSDVSNSGHQVMTIEDAIMSEVKKNLEHENKVPPKEHKILEPITPHAEESSFGSFPEETQSSFSLKCADEEEPKKSSDEQLEAVVTVEEETKPITKDETPIKSQHRPIDTKKNLADAQKSVIEQKSYFEKKPAEAKKTAFEQKFIAIKYSTTEQLRSVEPTMDFEKKPVDEQKSPADQQTIIEKLKFEISKDDPVKPATPTSLSSSRHKKHSKEKRYHSSDDKYRRRSRSKGRDRIREKSSLSHNKYSSSSSSKHSSSSSSKHSSHKSSRHDKSSSSTSRSSTAQESVSKRNQRTDSERRHKHSSSRSDNKEHSNSSTSKRSERHKTSTGTSTNDDHNDAKTKSHRRKSNDSNEGDKTSGPCSGSTSSSHKQSSSSATTSSSTSVKAKNVPNESSNANRTQNCKQTRDDLISSSDVVVLDGILQNPTTNFIDLKCSDGSIRAVVAVDSKCSEGEIKKEVDINPNKQSQLSPTTKRRLSENITDLHYFDPNDKVLKSRLELVNSLIESYRSVVNEFRRNEAIEKKTDEIDGGKELSTCEDTESNSVESILQTSEEETGRPKRTKRQVRNVSPASKKSPAKETSTLSNNQLSLHIECTDHAFDNASEDTNAGATRRKRSKRDDLKTSPTLSDTSVNSKENEIFTKKETVKGNRRHSRIMSASFSKLCQKQRYTNDDLYKPRPVLSQRSRRRRLDTVL